MKNKVINASNDGVEQQAVHLIGQKETRPAAQGGQWHKGWISGEGGRHDQESLQPNVEAYMSLKN
jgi:hypothetical protein